MHLNYLNQDPKWLSYQARNGIIHIQFSNKNDFDGEAKDRLKDFINNVGISLSQPNPRSEQRIYFRLLDTSMNDSVDILDGIITECSKSRNKDNIQDKHLIKIQILLADPECDFAKQRARSIATANDDEIKVNDPLKKTQSALEAISKKLKRLIYNNNRTNIENCPIQEGDYRNNIKNLADYINNHGKNYGLELKFYSEVPSGPMYFLRNILIQGRFCSGFSAIELPWMAIINDIECENDLYDIFSNEFDNIWQNLAYDLLKENLDQDIIDNSPDLNKVLEENERLKAENKRLKQDNQEQRQINIYNNNLSQSEANAMNDTSSFNVQGNNIQMKNVAGGDFKDNIIGNLPSSSDPQQPGIKESLANLIDAVNKDKSLKDYHKHQALNQLKEISDAWEDPNEESKQGKFETAKTILKTIFSALGPTANLLKIWSLAEPVLNKAFGSGN